MLAKLKYLKEEEKALKDIKNMITEQATRLKHEELYLKSLMRDSSQGFQDQSSFLQSHKAILETALVDDDSVNKVPLEDLQSQSSSQQQHLMKEPVHAEEEEEDEEEEESEEESGDCDMEEDGINTELMTLMQQMQKGHHYDDDF
ncbi:uncharacterized protein [Asterias amurensis]|uniref:uncharacterized protein isoform X2 n=1 Tax=Asterias amurensis TaxID=7602 RepID=UPI003AB30FF8